MSLATYQDKFRRLNVNVRTGRASPHKICLLLALLDLARSGGLAANRIAFAPPLLERYLRFFAAVRAPSDHANPYFPFFHLAGKLRAGEASFWHLQARPGREVVLQNMSTARNLADITDNIACATLDPELFELLQDAGSLDALAATLSTHWFDRGPQELHTIATRAREISRYEHRLRQGTVPAATEATPPAYVRDPAFRRVVIERCDHRCAATGLRVLPPSGEAMVEAAHIHPFSAAGDDDPRNGLALTPDMHRAMDRHLIAPGPDLKWHVSRTLDRRIPDLTRLTGLEGQALFLPREACLAPKREALQWQLEQLRRHGD